jgi:hypothetical protein
MDLIHCACAQRRSLAGSRRDRQIGPVLGRQMRVNQRSRGHRAVLDQRAVALERRALHADPVAARSQGPASRSSNSHAAAVPDGTALS